MAFTRAAFLFSLSAYMLVSDWASAFATGLGKLTDAFCSYLLGVSNEWYFLNGGRVPLPASQYKNLKSAVPTRHNILWTYNSGTNVLKIGPLRPRRHPTPITPEWLSASIEINGREISMDSWVQDFVYEQVNSDWFPPAVFAMCWSIHSKIWFTPLDDVQLHIITNTGDRTTFSLNEDWDHEWANMFLGEEDHVNEVEDREESESEEDNEEEEEGSEEEEEEDEAAEREQSSSSNTSLEETVAAAEQPAAEETVAAAEQLAAEQLPETQLEEID